jgi:FdhE protein
MSAPVHPEFARAGIVLRALSGAASAVPVRLPPDVPDVEAAEARLAGGVPALYGEPLLDWEELRRGVTAIAAALAGTDAAAAGAAVRERLERLDRPADAVDLELLVRAAVEGAWGVVEAAAIPLDVDPGALTALLDWAARPALRAAATRLAPALRAARWSRGHCPACGALPTLSVLRGKDRERRLHCGRCGTAWAFERVRCPSCGERDHERMGYLHGEGEGEHRRAEVCDSCRGYVKCVALLDDPGPERLVALDLETAALDFLALEAGYSRAGARGRSSEQR